MKCNILAQHLSDAAGLRYRVELDGRPATI